MRKLLFILLLLGTSISHSQKRSAIYDQFSCQLSNSWKLVVKDSSRGYFVRLNTHDTITFGGFQGDFIRQMCFPSDYCGSNSDIHEPTMLALIHKDTSILDSAELAKYKTDLAAIEKMNRELEQRYQKQLEEREQKIQQCENRKMLERQIHIDLGEPFINHPSIHIEHSRIFVNPSYRLSFALYIQYKKDDFRSNILFKGSYVNMAALKELMRFGWEYD